MTPETPARRVSDEDLESYRDRIIVNCVGPGNAPGFYEHIALDLIDERQRNAALVAELAGIEAGALTNAVVAACIKFLETELGWEWFRVEMFGPSHSARNAELLTKFLKEKGYLESARKLLAAAQAQEASNGE